MAGLVFDGFDARRGWPAPTQADHFGHDIRRPRKQRLDAAVATVARPPIETA
jgi:hypothetical protein